MLDLAKNRTTLSHYLVGVGMEIGALNSPLTIAHDNAVVRYADRMTTDALKAEYPSLSGIRTVDYVLAGNTLPVEDGSQDFVIGNHVIEHIVNPLGALKEWNRALKDGGIVFMAYPIPKHCPDAPRRIVTVEHLIEDFETNRRTNAGEHLLAFAWAWNPTQFPAPDEIERVLHHLWQNDLWEMDEVAWDLLHKSRDRVEYLRSLPELELHQHAFDLQAFRGSLEYLSDRAGVHFSVEDLSFDRGAINECIMILRKHSTAPVDGVWGPRARAAEAREIYLSSDIAADTAASRNRLLQIEALTNSTSWRVTSPLRAFKRYIDGR